MYTKHLFETNTSFIVDVIPKFAVVKGQFINETNSFTASHKLMKRHLTKHHHDLYDCWCNIMPWNRYFIQILVFRVLARKGLNYAFCMNWERKCSSGSGHTVSLSIASGRPGDKAFKKFTIFSLKLVYFLLKVIKQGFQLSF